MGINTTVIPSKIDASAVDDKYIAVTSTNKITVGTSYYRNEALQELRLITIEAGDGLTGVDDDQADVYEDADGLLNTVDSATSTYDATDKAYENNVFLDTTQYNGSISATTYETFKTYTTGVPTDIPSVTMDCRPNFTTRWARGRIKFNYSDATSEYSNLYYQDGGTWSSFTFNNPNVAKDCVSFEIQGYGERSDYDRLEVKNITFLSGVPLEQYVKHSFSKTKKPTSVYAIAYDKDGEITNAGDLTIEFTNETTPETSGELNLNEPNVVTLTNVPEFVYIHQKDTAFSQVKYYVLFMGYD